MEKYGNISLCAFADEADENLDNQILALQQNDIGFLEIRGVNGKNISELTIEEVKNVKVKLDRGGIKVWSIGSPIGKLDINENFEPHLDLFCHLIEAANILEASHFRLFSFHGTYHYMNSFYMEDVVFERLGKFIEKSKGSGVTLCHENESNIYGDIISRLQRIHKQFPEIKAVFDPANFVQCKQDTIKAWKILSKYVAYIHAKDALEDGTVVPVGYGAGNLKTILHNFAQDGGTVTLEPHLTEFTGRKTLDKNKDLFLDKSVDEKVFSLNFSNPREAFDAAANALKELLKDI